MISMLKYKAQLYACVEITFPLCNKVFDLSGNFAR